MIMPPLATLFSNAARVYGPLISSGVRTTEDRGIEQLWPRGLDRRGSKPSNRRKLTPAKKPPKYYPADNAKQPIPNLLSSLRALVFLSSPLLRRERWHRPLLERHPPLHCPRRHGRPRPSLPTPGRTTWRRPATCYRRFGAVFSLRLLAGARRKPTLLRPPSSPLCLLPPGSTPSLPTAASLDLLSTMVAKVPSCPPTATPDNGGATLAAALAAGDRWIKESKGKQGRPSSATNPKLCRPKSHGNHPSSNQKKGKKGT